MALLQANLFSKSLMRTVTIHVILPVDKLAPDGNFIHRSRPFKTLYLLHGILGNYTDWVFGTRIQRWAQDENLAVVMPSGENHFYVDLAVPGSQYGEFTGKELVELTRAMFPLSHKREDTFIGGLSMGGYGALVNGLKYNNTFSRIIALSTAFILNEAVNSTEDSLVPFQKKSFYTSIFGDVALLPDSAADYHQLILSLIEKGAVIPDIFMACGTEDPLLDSNRAYERFLTEHNVKHTYLEGSGSHEWDFWDTYIRKALDWLPLENTSESVSSGNVRLEMKAENEPKKLKDKS